MLLNTTATEIDAEQRFRDFIDETCDEVTVGNMSWDASRVLEEMDPTAFRRGVSDYTSSQIDEGVWFEWEDGTLYDEPEYTEEDTEDEEEDTEEEEEEPCDICGLDH